MARGDAEQMVLRLPYMILIDRIAHQQMPLNVCVDVAHSLRCIYHWLGIETWVAPVELSIEDIQGRRSGTHYGHARPYFDGTVFMGHCVLWLPETEQFIDATIGQFPPMAKGSGAPLVADGPGTNRAFMTQDVPPDQRRTLVIPREGWFLKYTPAEQAYVSSVYEGVAATPAFREAFTDNGVHVLAQMLGMLGIDPEVTARARRGGAPNLVRLLDLTAGGTCDPETGQPDQFTFPAGTSIQLGEHLGPPPAPPTPLTWPTAPLSSAPITPCPPPARPAVTGRAEAAGGWSPTGTRPATPGPNDERPYAMNNQPGEGGNPFEDSQFCLGLSRAEHPNGDVVVAAMVVWATQRRVFEVVGTSPAGTPETIDMVIGDYLSQGMELADLTGPLIPSSPNCILRGWRISLDTAAEELTILAPDGARALVGTYTGRGTPDMDITQWLAAAQEHQLVFLYTGAIDFTDDGADLETARRNGTLLLGSAALTGQPAPTAPASPPRRRRSWLRR